MNTDFINSLIYLSIVVWLSFITITSVYIFCILPNQLRRHQYEEIV